jgi:hypothetical protein
VTKAKKFKQAVRAAVPPGGSYQDTLQAMQKRIRRTGEHYTVALAAMRAGKPIPGSLTDAEVIAEYGPHLGIPLPSET